MKLGSSTLNLKSAPKIISERVPIRIRDQNVVFDYDASDYNSYPQSGLTWFDLSGNGNNGALTGGNSWTSFLDGAMFYNGTNGYTNIANSASLNITENITLETWFRADALANPTHGDGLISKGLSSDGNSALYETFLLSGGGVNNVRIRIKRQGASPVSLVVPNLVVSEIYHSVFTMDRDFLHSYLDGKQDGSTICDGVMESNTNGMALGSRWFIRGSPVTDSHLTGVIFKARIYNRVLTAKEVLDNYNAEKHQYGKD